MISESNPNTVHPSPSGCPGRERLTLFVERGLPPAEMAETAAHVATCGTCAESVRDLAEWLAADRPAAPEMLFRVRMALLPARWRAVAAAFVPDREILAAADGQSADQIQQETAVRSGFLHFAAALPEGHRDGWRAKLAIPASVTEETVLRISVEDGAGRPVEAGTLVFCGVALDVLRGRVFLPVRTFRDNIGTAMIALKRDGGGEVPGEPVLAGDLEA